jgi:hypothetical protein
MIQERDDTYFKDRYDLIMHRFSLAKRVIDYRGLPEKWARYEKCYRNEYWDGSKRLAHLSRFSSNRFFENVETKMSFVVSRPPQPEIEVEPPMDMIQGLQPQPTEEPEQQPIGEPEVDYEQRTKEFQTYMERLADWQDKLSKHLKDVWIESFMQEVFHQAYREHEIKGNSGIKVTIQDSSIRTEVCDITTWYPDPDQEDLAGCEKTWFIQAYFLTPRDIKRIFNVDVEPEGYFDDRNQFKYFSILNRALDAARSVAGMEGKKKEGYSLVIEMYTSDDDKLEEEYQVEMVDDDGVRKRNEAGEVMKETKTRPLYRSGKRIETIIRNLKDKVVKDEENTLGRLPFLGTCNLKRAGDFWGTSDCLNIEYHIHAKNHVMSNIIDNIRLHGNPQWKKRKGTAFTVTNEGGKVYDVENMSDLEIVQPAMVMSPGVMNLIEYFDKDSDTISGTKEPLRGESLSGDSGIKTQSLINQAVGRLQPQIAQFTELARTWYEIVTDITVKSGQPILLRDEDEQGKANYNLFDPREFVDAKIKVRVNSMSMMPFDKYAEWEEGKIYFDAQLMSPEQFIDLAPSLRDKQRAKKFVAEMQEKQDRQLQLQQAMEQFKQIAEQASEVSETTPGTEQEDQLVQPLIQMVQQFPELMMTPEFQALPDRLRLFIVAVIGGVGQQTQMQTGGQVQ